ncbi:MAG: glucose-6-phosphate dehydrogenase [Planctomycetota bacterium]|jgi:glucose-6-phosphate 1-dehydrogenase
MQKIKPSAIEGDALCADTVAGPSALVVFGASGDLVHRKLLVSMFRLYQQNLLDERSYILGCGRREFSDAAFRSKAGDSIRKSSNSAPLDELHAFTARLYYLDGDYNDADFYRRIMARLGELDKKHDVHENLVFYLSVPPFLYSAIVDHLGSSQLACADDGWNRQTRLVVEKPFGRDLQSALELNDSISRCFSESQIYRIDHYLGKETVQNILMLRFANTIYEPIWNRNYIDNVQITIAETVGVEHRAGYYDSTGALRDMFQNHMLQMLTLVAMEPPVSFEADYIRDEKAKLLHSIRPFDLGRLDDLWVRGQYGAGTIDGKQVRGYLDEPGVRPASRTETYVAAKLFVDNWRWQDVPFYLRTGKRLAAKDTEVAIAFKKVPYSMFSAVGLDDLPANVLVMHIQPEEGISLSFQAKRPGSKICMSTLKMDFSYKSIFSAEMPEAYQRLLLDCMVGDQTLFTRHDNVEVSWSLLTPVLDAWERSRAVPEVYPAGCESFAQADRLIAADRRQWRPVLHD